MAERPDYHLDIDGLDESARSPSSPAESDTSRKWVGIHFDCCGVYQRVYRNRDGSAYQGSCPRCRTPVAVPIGPGGTSARIFRKT